MAALRGSTAGGVTLFAKNSDRQRNEAHWVERRPRAKYSAGETLACTYISVPQVRETHAVLLCRPFWIWGAEMGANEHGVAIGNEAVHARLPAQERPALLGMDLLRLALERAASAQEAVHVITGLLERYGQGGNGGHQRVNYYNNSFLIADQTEAFVLETVGREWLLERVSDVRAISNRYSINERAGATSSGMSALVRTAGDQQSKPPDYAEVLADPHRQHIAQACQRAARATALLKSNQGRLQFVDIARILRDHWTSETTSTDPRAATEYSLCMHGGAADRGGQTTGSLISEIRSSGATHWVTATAAPCLSLFKPVLFDVSLPDFGPKPDDHYDPSTLWWRHEHYHRAVLRGDLGSWLQEIKEERDALEAEAHALMSAVESASSRDRHAAVSLCWGKAAAAEERWARAVPARTWDSSRPYDVAWEAMSEEAGLPTFEQSESLRAS